MNASAELPAGAATAVRLACAGPTVFAAGAWFKNAVCAARGDLALLSAVAGDLDTPDACRAHEDYTKALLDWLGDKPTAVACDLHPDFHSSREAARLADTLGVPLLPIQHHHAHIGAICAEHGVEGPVLGLALDGVGLGTDGTPWGGELLKVDGARFERLGHLRPLALPGGDRAAREPWRVAAAVLHALGRADEIPRRYADEPAAAALVTMIERGLNSPTTSSAGRLFDAAAGLLGISRRMEFEAQAAIDLERAATHHVTTEGWPAPLAWSIGDDGRLDLLPALGVLAGCDRADFGAAQFHATLVAALADWVARAADANGIATVALGGGCFLNKLLSAGLRERLGALGLAVLEVGQLSPGDAGLAVGQAWIAQRSK